MSAHAKWHRLVPGKAFWGRWRVERDATRSVRAPVQRWVVWHGDRYYGEAPSQPEARAIAERAQSALDAARARPAPITSPEEHERV